MKTVPVLAALVALTLGGTVPDKLHVETNPDSQSKFFRNDYTYFHSTDSFYKIHTTQRPWEDAKTTCAAEGASLLFPENQNEADVVATFLKNSQPTYWWSFVDAHLASGIYKTTNGVPVSEKYHIWAQGEPEDKTCVVLTREGNLKVENCRRNYPFTCKKTVNTLYINNLSNQDSQPKFFRNDYTYFHSTDSFYKIHTTQRPWEDAKTTCAAEGASLLFPENQNEADVVATFLKNSQPTYWWSFVDAHLASGIYKTTNGVPVSEKYHIWAQGEPENKNSKTCVVLTREGKLKVEDCTRNYPFTCKKTVNTLYNNNLSNQDSQPKFFRNDYTYFHSTDSFYKIHTTQRPWEDAKTTCAAEGASLLFPENQNEADVVATFLKNSQPTYWWSFVDAHLASGIYKTTNGVPVSEKYHIWAQGEPENKNSKTCVVLTREGKLKVEDCTRNYPFTCKKTVNTLYNNNLSNQDSQPKFFRNDYTYFHSTDSFYKIHTTQRPWEDAKTTCAAEGASLLFPENQNEADVVATFLKNSQPTYWWSFVDAHLASGIYKTTNGVPVSEKYHIWAQGEPENKNSKTCVVLTREGKLKVEDCTRNYPFTCKKTVNTLYNNNLSNQDSQPKFFRNDYTYFHSTDSFYKIHTTQRPWEDAKTTCAAEGASLLFPENQNEADVVATFLKNSQPTYWWSFVDAHLASGIYKTTNGVPVSEKYHIWAQGEPENKNSKTCVVLTREGKLKVEDCTRNYPFTCKKTVNTLYNNNLSNQDSQPKFFRNDYTYFHSTDSFYKIHTTQRPWEDAKTTCAAEGASLLFPENQNEADVVATFLKNSQPTYWWSFVDAHLASGIYKTTNGVPVSEKYHIWAQGEPENKNSKTCVVLTREGKLKVEDCTRNYPFTCKKTVNTLYNNNLSNQDSQPKFFRNDYTYFHSTDSFYKIHTTQRPWEDAKTTCAAEGASLLFPENQNEADVVATFLKNSQPTYWWSFVDAHLASGVYKTTNGVPVSEKYHIWAQGEPENKNSKTCVVLTREGKLKVEDCTRNYPFTCKKTVNTLYNNNLSNQDSQPKFFRNDYTYFHSTDSFYKIHTTQRPWEDAKTTCAAEGASLLFPENQNEADVVATFLKNSQPTYWWSFVDAHLASGVYKTTNGVPVSEKYHIWAQGEPENKNSKTCVVLTREGKLKVEDCTRNYPFTCKKTVNTLYNNNLSNQDSQPKFFRNDYTYFHSTDSFYKIHTTQRPWDDAKTTCAAEGASLLFPENQNEADVVATFLKNSQPTYWWSFVDAHLASGIYKTTYGVPVSEKYHIWAQGEPENKNSKTCVVLTREGKLKVEDCTRNYPFTCKKTVNTLYNNNLSNQDSQPKFFRNDYTYFHSTDSFYKIHTTQRPWDDAKTTCAAEGASLLYPENQNEADVVATFLKNSQPTYWWSFVDAHLASGIYKTTNGVPVSEKYHIWAQGEPENKNSKTCVVLTREGKLKVEDCTRNYPFTCKKTVNTLYNNNLSNQDSQPKFFRNDYTYFHSTDSFYKIHTTQRPWDDAKTTCAAEGASLLFPENQNEADVVATFLKNSQPTYWWSFVDAHLASGIYKTTNGVPVSEKYHIWAQGEPEAKNSRQTCVVLTREGKLKVEDCTRNYPFACKKTVPALEWNTLCNNNLANQDARTSKKFFRRDYNYCNSTNSFYKIHTIHKPWEEAKKTCAMEGATLLYPEDENEATVVTAFLRNTQPKFWWLFVGARFAKEVYESIDGVPVSNKYNNWAPGELDGPHSEACVVLTRENNLRHFDCTARYPFICKKTLSSLKWNTLCNMPKQDVHTQFFRNDYTYLDSTESFYKLHTIQKPWKDAISTCAKEEASLLYPEDENEAVEVAEFLKISKPGFWWVFVSASDHLAKGVYQTIDGVPVSNKYSNWAPGEPSASNSKNCVVLTREGVIQDEDCTRNYPFICKKTVSAWELDKFTGIIRDYEYNEAVERCYKFHLNPLSWSDAYATCAAEQSYLAIINSDVEAEILANLTARAPTGQVAGDYERTVVHLGFHDKDDEGWRTTKGVPLDDIGYSQWSQGEPNGKGRDKCGSMYNNGQLNDVGCTTESFFICEHEIDTSVALDNRVEDEAGVLNFIEKSPTPDNESYDEDYATDAQL